MLFEEWGLSVCCNRSTSPLHKITLKYRVPRALPLVGSRGEAPALLNPHQTLSKFSPFAPWSESPAGFCQLRFAKLKRGETGENLLCAEQSRQAVQSAELVPMASSALPPPSTCPAVIPDQQEHRHEPYQPDSADPVKRDATSHAGNVSSGSKTGLNRGRDAHY